MNTLQRYIHWLCRVNHCRGFGVQSPSAYRFIRYVINEHYPYYAYAELRAAGVCRDRLERKRMELYLRIANWRQATLWLDFGDGGEAISQYVGRGCKGTQVRAAGMPLQTGEAHAIEVMRVCPRPGCERMLDEALHHTADSTLLIIEDIGTNQTARRMWQQLLASGRVSVTYDLHYLGIAFFDCKRFKANYIVNF